MPISKKIFWIFLSISIIIFALAASVIAYQHSNKYMHKVLHSLIEFNDNVYKLRELQLNMVKNDGVDTTYELQRSVERLKESSDNLARSLSEVVKNDLNVTSLNTDISNYYKSIYEYIDNSLQYKMLKEDSIKYIDKLKEVILSYYPSKKSLVSKVNLFLTDFITTGDPNNLTKINEITKQLVKDNQNSELKTITQRLNLTLETMYLNRLSVNEKRNFLSLSSSNFLQIVSILSLKLKERDAKLNATLNYSLIIIIIVCTILGLLYWVLINKYINRFLSNQSEVMTAIKSREALREIKPFSSDELGELTQKMWEMAADLYKKDEALIESEYKYRTYINTTPVAVLVSDSNRKILEVNQGAVNLLGYSSEELLSFSLDDIWIEEENTFNKKQFKNLTKKGSISLIRKFRTKESGFVYANVSGIKISDNRFVAFCQDISEQVSLEKELKEVNENLIEQVNKEVDKNLKQDQIIQQQKKLADMGMMVSAIAHQWRQPLNALALCVQDVLEEYESGDINKEYVKDFEDNSMKLIMHMSKTIDDFRDFFMPDKNVTEFNVVKEINDLVRLLNVQITSKRIEMEFICHCKGGTINCDNPSATESCENETDLVMGFPGEFKQVLINLIYNSVDAICEARVLKKISKGNIDIKVMFSENNMTVSINDNGGGIPSHVLPHIFDPYYTTKGEGQGTGIGLYMSKVIIESHMSGRMNAKNILGGACLTIELPLIKKIV